MKELFLDLLNSETAFKRSVRGLLMGLGALAVSGSVPLLEPYKEYGALLLGLGGMIGVGEPNPKP